MYISLPYDTPTRRHADKREELLSLIVSAMLDTFLACMQISVYKRQKEKKKKKKKRPARVAEKL